MLRGPGSPPFGRSFELDGSASYDVGGGRVVQYIWTYLGPDGSADERMARFDVNTPITTREPTITVDAGLPIGRHRFRLEVIDASGRAARRTTRSSRCSGSSSVPEPVSPAPGTGHPEPGRSSARRRRRPIIDRQPRAPSRDPGAAASRRPEKEGEAMNRLSRAPEADPLYARPAAERPSYATGMLLDAQDFTDEQTYHRGRLARALASLTGGGTLAGLRVEHTARPRRPTPRPEEIRVEPGLAVDRLGRLIEVPRPACLRLQVLVRRRVRAPTAATGCAAPPTEPRCASSRRGRSPRQEPAAGRRSRARRGRRCLRALHRLRAGAHAELRHRAFDALDAVATSRVRDAYELQLVARDGLDDDFDGLPAPGPDLAGIADPAERRAACRTRFSTAIRPAAARAARASSIRCRSTPPGSTRTCGVRRARGRSRSAPPTRRRAPAARCSSTAGGAASFPRRC